MQTNRLLYYDKLICCPTCNAPLRLHDKVKIDIVATITHEHCFHSIKNKDMGTYKEILEKYPNLFPDKEEMQ